MSIQAFSEITTPASGERKLFHVA